MTTIKVAQTYVDVAGFPSEPTLDVSQVAVEVAKTVPVTVTLQVGQLAVEVVRSPPGALEVGQFCIELLRPVAGTGRLEAALTAEASIVVDFVEPTICVPCIPIYYNTDVVFRPYVTPEPPCSPTDCPVDDYRSE